MPSKHMLGLRHCIRRHFLIGQDHCFDKLTEMMPVACNWKAIGTGLRIDPGHLDTIQENNSGKPKECLSAYLLAVLVGERFL